MAKRGVYRRRHRKDANQDSIVAFYRAAGASVEIIGEPTDLAVGLGRVTDLVEVKTETGALNADQEAFLNTWRGSLVVIRTLEEARTHVRSLQRRSSILDASRGLVGCMHGEVVIQPI